MPTSPYAIYDGHVGGVILSAAKDLCAQPDRPFAALRVTIRRSSQTLRGVDPEPIRYAQGQLREGAQGDR